MFRAVIVIGVVLCARLPPLQAEHARIDLRVSGEGKEVNAFADQEPPAGGRNKRPVLRVHVNKPLVLQFFLTEHVSARGDRTRHRSLLCSEPRG